MKATAWWVACATVVTLAGCAPSDSTSPESDSVALVDGCAPSGDVVLSLDVPADQSQAPELTISGPLQVDTTERVVVVEGSGDEVKEDDQVLMSYSIFNGTSGEKIGHQGYDGEDPAPFPVTLSADYLQGVSYTLLCSTVGSRVVGVIPAEQAYGPEGMPQYGLQPGDPIVLVADVIGIQPPPEPPLERLEGEALPAPEGFPTVSYDESGRPTVVADTSNVPTDFALARVIDGSGQDVLAGSSVVVHYHGVNLSTGEVFDSSWDRGEPATFPTSGVIDGFRDGLVGQKVGSRVLIVIPPQLGYGPSGGTQDGRIGPEDTIFFVVDILGVA